MKTKQEAIKEAYGHHWETVKQHVDENGFLEHPKGGEVTFDPFIGFMEEHPIKDAFRPKSLSGIENNNGWLSIKHHGLPNKFGAYWTFTQNNKEPSANTFGLFGSTSWTFDDDLVSHYQLIIKPNNPIY